MSENFDYDNIKKEELTKILLDLKKENSVLQEKYLDLRKKSKVNNYHLSVVIQKYIHLKNIYISLLKNYEQFTVTGCLLFIWFIFFFNLVTQNNNLDEMNYNEQKLVSSKKKDVLSNFSSNISPLVFSSPSPFFSSISPNYITPSLESSKKDTLFPSSSKKSTSQSNSLDKIWEDDDDNDGNDDKPLPLYMVMSEDSQISNEKVKKKVGKKKKKEEKEKKV
jgi:hypothetical protein